MADTIQIWQQAILSRFTPKRECMLLVIDPDNLTRYDVLLAEIQNRNYDVLELADEVAFRAAFERTYRSRWDAGELLHVIVVVHTTNGERHIPYDLWKKSRRVELSLPPDVYPVYPPGIEMFASEDATMVSHGGLSLEELVVPFAEVELA